MNHFRDMRASKHFGMHWLLVGIVARLEGIFLFLIYFFNESVSFGNLKEKMESAAALS